jgi:hypothetical protein
LDELLFFNTVVFSVLYFKKGSKEIQSDSQTVVRDAEDKGTGLNK